MPTCQQVTDKLQEFAPLALAEDWDNVGLLLGDSQRSVSRIMTCLTLTPDVAAEAVAEHCDLIITHHPILFRPVQRITNETSQGAMLQELIRHRIAVYSPHTAFDSAAQGINQQSAERLELQDIQPLRPTESTNLSEGVLGSGRWGRLSAALSLNALLLEIQNRFDLRRLQYVSGQAEKITRVAIACGSAAGFMKDAQSHDCEVFITGEARFHDCLEARQRGLHLVLIGHYGSERFACETLADMLEGWFMDVSCHASRVECDPLQWT